MTSRRDFVKQAGLAGAGIVAAKLPFNSLANAEDKRYRELRAAIIANTNLLRIPGLAAAVIQDGNMTFLQTEGFADLAKKTPMRRDHIFPVASLTKTLAAVTLMMYEQEGKMSMEDYVLDYPFLPVGLTPNRLQTPNLKIKHVLSHTSEGEPGANYIYSGNRYSFVYGVFEKMSGNTIHYEAFAQEVTRKILRPLNMKDTLPGYPTDKNHPAISRIATTYLWDREQQANKADTGLSGANILFPANNLFSTIDDLAAYTRALDQNTLLIADNYKKLTSPFITLSGRPNPYGLGWSTQEIAGRQVHWHYGYGDSCAALIVRIPQDKLSFILLTNSVGASEPFWLGYGNLLNSVFAHAFFKHVVSAQKGQFNYQEVIRKPLSGASSLYYDGIFSQALMRHHIEQNQKSHQGEALMLMKYLAANDPGRFRKLDVSVICLLAELNDPGLKNEMESAVRAYADSGWFHPQIHGPIARWYERNGMAEASRVWYHKLADSKAYDEQGDVKEARNVLGKYYLAQGEKEKGRSYLWQNALLNFEEAPQQIINMKSR